MSNHPTLAVLRDFYTLLTWQAAIFLFGLGLFLLLRPGRRSLLLSRRLSGYRVLRLGFGTLWIIDGLLEAQPAMTTQFIPDYVEPLLKGQPNWYATLMERGALLWSAHPLFWDSLVVWLQITIGLMILGDRGPVRQAGLWVSLVWSATVWIMGEGLGQIFVAGHNTWLVGCPGSAVFYGLAAILLLMSPERWKSGRVRRLAERFFSVMWGLCAFLQAWPGDGFWSGTVLVRPVLDMARMPQPAFFSRPLYWMAHLWMNHPVAFNGCFVAVMGILSLAWWTRARWAAPLTILWATVTWWIGQDFGVLGGLGTDPNSGLAVIILVTAISQKRASERFDETEAA